MDKTPAYYVFLGLLVGALAGSVIGALNGDIIRGIQLGAGAGLLIGWIMTAPAFHK